MLFFDFSSFFLSFMPIPMSDIANHYSNSNGTTPAAAQTGNCFSKKRAFHFEVPSFRYFMKFRIRPSSEFLNCKK